jgi:hypothetical protein
LRENIFCCWLFLVVTKTNATLQNFTFRKRELRLKVDRLNSSLEAVGTAATTAAAAATAKPAAASATATAKSTAAGIVIGGERSAVGGCPLVTVVPDLLIDVLAVAGVVQRGVDTDEEGGRHAVAEKFK